MAVMLRIPSGCSSSTNARCSVHACSKSAILVVASLSAHVSPYIRVVATRSPSTPSLVRSRADRHDASSGGGRINVADGTRGPCCAGVLGCGGEWRVCPSRQPDRCLLFLGRRRFDEVPAAIGDGGVRPAVGEHRRLVRDVRSPMAATRSRPRAILSSPSSRSAGDPCRRAHAQRSPSDLIRSPVSGLIRRSSSCATGVHVGLDVHLGPAYRPLRTAARVMSRRRTKAAPDQVARDLGEHRLKDFSSAWYVLPAGPR